MPNYQLPGENKLRQEFPGPVLPSWPLYFLFADFPFALESREHRLLALLVYLSLDDALFALQSAFSSSEEAGLHRLHPPLSSSPSSFSSSDTCPSDVLTWVTLSSTCFAARRSDRFRSIFHLRQENEILPTDLNRDGATRQTSLSGREDEIHPQETETTTLR